MINSTARNSNKCAECARSYGPHYRGECEHGAPIGKRDSKRARSQGTARDSKEYRAMMVSAQEQSARILSESETRGEIAHTLYIASVQVEPFTAESE